MKWLIPGIAIAALGLSSLADAHAHLRRSTPANHSTLAVAPPNVTLEFQEAVQLTAAAIGKVDAKPQKIGSLPAAASKVFTLPLPSLDPGTYVIKWRAASDDGHVMSDTIQFVVSPSVAPAAR
jgi:copper resistance protein C